VINIDGVKELTTERCQEFNRRVADAEAKNNVVYRTYSASEERQRVFLPLRPSWKIINEREGENDGLVSSSRRIGPTTSWPLMARANPFNISVFHFPLTT